MTLRVGRAGARYRGAIVAVVLTVILGALVLAAPASARTLSPQTKINRRAAIHQAGLRLRQIRVPPGSDQVQERPPAIGNLLGTAPYTFGGSRNVERHDFWVTPLAPRIARIVNRQRVVQLSGAIGCPEETTPVAGPGEPPPPPPSVMNLSFRAGPHRPVQATVSQRENPGICHEMSFRAAGVRMQELESGDEVLPALLPERERAVKVDRRSWAGGPAAAAIATAVGRKRHPHNCPGKAIPEADVRRRNKNPRSRSALVPEAADEIVLCRYFGTGEGATKGDRRGVGHLARQRIIRRPASVAELVDSFQKLSPVSKGFESCFFDNGASLEAIARYPGEAPVFAFVHLSGCEIATNGRSDAVFLSSGLGAQLRRLTKVTSPTA